MKRIFPIVFTLLAPHFARASSMTEPYVNFGGTVNVSTGNRSDTVYVNQFDPELGTLTGIQATVFVHGSAQVTTTGNPSDLADVLLVGSVSAFGGVHGLSGGDNIGPAGTQFSPFASLQITASPSPLSAFVGLSTTAVPVDVGLSAQVFTYGGNNVPPYPTGSAISFADSGSIQMQYTFTIFGDANNDSIVNGQDINLVASHWLQTGVSMTGDVTRDGIVNGQDIAMIASHWLWTSTGAPGQGTSVPEPPTLCLAIKVALLSLVAAHRMRPIGPGVAK